VKLLIITQVLDTKHPGLGFFHRWVEEFATHVDSVEVIALSVGTYSLPANVRVHSLGKEQGENRFKYLWRFYFLTWQLRREYDTVFVHMNQIYLVLGGLLWRLAGKRMGLWYAHGTVTPTLKVATLLTHRIFSVSVTSFPLISKKLCVTGHGIDIRQFAPAPKEKVIDLITVGRISETKNLHTLIKYFSKVVATQSVTLTIVGPQLTSADKVCYQQLLTLIKELKLEQRVVFLGPKTSAELPCLLQQSRLFVHTAYNGSIDKAVLEALAVGVPVVTTAAVNAELPVWYAPAEQTFVELTGKVLQSTTNQVDTESGRLFICQHHSLQSLIPKIVTSL